MVDINPVSSIETSKAIKASTKLTENFETFLTLLTTQLRSQDPLEPMDPSEFTNQLVQFTEVEQSIATNKNLEQLVALANQNELSGAVSLIGKQVEAPETRSILENGSAEWTYSLNDQAKEVRLRVLDENNVAVFSTSGNTTLGNHQFSWNGIDKDGNQLDDGKYSLLVTAKDREGNSINSKINMIGTVKGVFSRDGKNMLEVGGIPISLSEIISVKQEKENNN